jgi:hypothetical protein
LKESNILNQRISFDYHHLWLKKKEFHEFPTELICYLNKEHKKAKESGVKQCNRDSIFIKERYDIVRVCKETIKNQIELKKKVCEEIEKNSINR